MKIEKERKFLINGKFTEKAFKVLKIRQAFINSDPERSVRIRTIDDKHYLTIKGPFLEELSDRLEWERQIDFEEASSLFSIAEDGIIEKSRHLIQHGKQLIEVDVFHGVNKGLIIAEVEYKPGEESDFKKPAWLGEEITGDVKYYNAYLFIKPYSMW